MKKLSFLLLVSIVFNSFFFIPNNVEAATINNPTCQTNYSGYATSAEFPDSITFDTSSFRFKVTFDPRRADKNLNYFIKVSSEEGFRAVDRRTDRQKIGADNTITFFVNEKLDKQALYSVKLMHNENFLPGPIALKDDVEVCNLGKIDLTDKAITNASCSFPFPTNIKSRENFSPKVISLKQEGIKYNFRIFKKSDAPNVPSGITTGANPPLNPGKAVFSKSGISSPEDTISVNNVFENGPYVALVEVERIGGFIPIPGTGAPFLQPAQFKYCFSANFTISEDPTTTPVTPPIGGAPPPDCTTTNTCNKSAGLPCNIESGAEDINGTGVLTAIGCIPTDPKTLITKLMLFSAGIGGGIALLLMVFGAFQMMTAAGNPEAIKKGKDQFLAAAIGLLFVIFSALLLRIIGVDILNIPGFSN